MTAGDTIGTRIRSPIAAAGRAVLDLLMPHQCMGCGEITGGEGALCATCWAGMAFIAAPVCVRCGYPFDLDIGTPEGDNLCGACIRNPPPWERARAVFRYDDASRSLILGFKHGDRTYAAPSFGVWLARAAGALAEDADLIVPVPLHRLRLFRRRYNQAALLAQACGKIADRPCIPDLLRRVRATPSQGRLSRARRKQNVRDAFAVSPRFRDTIQGRRILLVDDVLTTGATAESATLCLLRAGAGAVDVVTLARVVRPLA